VDDESDEEVKQMMKRKESLHVAQQNRKLKEKELDEYIDLNNKLKGPLREQVHKILKSRYTSLT
jgi:hypothetical protein